MSEEFEFTQKVGNQSTHSEIGGSSLEEEVVAKGTCPFCGTYSAFRQIAKRVQSDEVGYMVILRCDTCMSIMACSVTQHKLYPTPGMSGISDLPEGIDEYYQEALRCIKANAPNGAATVFRKVIHAVGLEYNVVEEDDDLGFYEVINKLSDAGHITDTLRDSLLAIKDVGNDGAHINQNDPTIDQVRNLKNMTDSVLTATVIAEQRVNKARDEHENPHAEQSDG
jgi:hypothetical protein